MTTQSILQGAQYRLAQHYLGKLQRAESGTRWGQQNRLYWLNRIQQDWAQIKQWQAWSASWTESEPDRAQLCLAFPLATSSVLRIRQLPSETLVWLQQALKAARRLGEDEAERTLLHLTSVMYANLESFETAEQYANKLLELAQAAHDRRSVGCAWLTIGRVQEFRGELDSAERLFFKSIELLEPYPLEEYLASAWQGLARIALRRGDYELSYDYHVKLLEHSQALGYEGKVAIAHLSLSGILIYVRNYPEAEFHAQRGVDLARQIDFRRLIPAALVSLAHAQKWLGKLEAACLTYEEALRERPILAPSTVINALYGLGQALYRLGDLERALPRFLEASEIAREKQILFRLCEVLPDLVVLQLAREHLDEARAALAELIPHTIQLGTHPYMANALGAAVLLWQKLQKPDQAAQWTGILTNYSQHLNPTWYNASVFAALEAALGTEGYQQALVRGKAVSLENALAEVKTLLDAPINVKPML